MRSLIADRTSLGGAAEPRTKGPGWHPRGTQHRRQIIELLSASPHPAGPVCMRSVCLLSCSSMRVLVCSFVSVCSLVCPFVCLFVCLFVCSSMCVLVCSFVSVSLSFLTCSLACLFVYLFVCLFVCLFV